MPRSARYLFISFANNTETMTLAVFVGSVVILSEHGAFLFVIVIISFWTSISVMSVFVSR